MQDSQHLKAQIISVLDSLPLEGLKLLAEFAAFLRAKFNLERPQPQTDLDQDPLIGLFAGPTDLAAQSEEILQQGMVEKTGWTWKETPL